MVAASPEQDAIIQLSLAGKTPPQQAAQQFLSQQGVQAGNTSTQSINGLPAASGYFQAQTEQGAVQGLVTFLSYNGHTYGILGYTPGGKLSQYDQAFRQTIGSFGPLKNQAALNVQPAKVELMKLQREMTLEQFNQQYPSIDSDRGAGDHQRDRVAEHGDSGGADHQARRGGRGPATRRVGTLAATREGAGSATKERSGASSPPLSRSSRARGCTARRATEAHLVGAPRRLRILSNTPYHISRVSRPVFVFWRLGWNDVTSTRAVGQRRSRDPWPNGGRVARGRRSHQPAARSQVSQPSRPNASTIADAGQQRSSASRYGTAAGQLRGGGLVVAAGHSGPRR